MEHEQTPLVLVFSTAYLPLVGGAEVAINEIVKRIDKVRFLIFTARFSQVLPKAEKRGHVEILRLGFGSRFDKWLLPFFAYGKARTILRREKKAVLWGVMISQAAIAAYWLKRKYPRVPLVITLQEGDSEEHLQRARGGLIHYYWQRVLGSADEITAISSYLARRASSFGYKKEVRVIPNGVREDFLKDVSEDKIQSLRERYHIGNNHKVILSVSRLVKKNGLEELIEAFKVVHAKHPETKLMIVGDGIERKNLESLTKKKGLESEVIFTGTIPHDEILTYYKISYLFARFPVSEGLGSVFLEAMGAGVPIVTFVVGGIGDLREHLINPDASSEILAKGAGFAVSSRSIEGFAAAMNRFLENSALWGHMRVVGPGIVRGKYLWLDIVQKMEETLTRSIARLRILVATGIYPPDIGGPATYTKTIAEAFARRGHDVTVVSYYNAAIQKTPFLFVPISRAMPKGLRHFLYFWKVFRHARARDVIYAQDPISAGVPAALAALLLHKRFIIKIVGDYAWEQGVARFGVSDLLGQFHKKRYGIRVEILRTIEKIVARSAHSVIVPSGYLQGVVEKWGVAASRIRVVPNGAEIPMLPSREKARRFVGHQGTLFLSVGRLVPWKGFMCLIRILPKLSGSLIIAGDGPLRKSLEEEAQKSGVEEKVIFTGALSRENLLSYMAAADVFLLNTGYEGFSHQLLEAMGAGIPIVTTLEGGNRDIVRDGENALVARYNNEADWVDAIKKILDDKTLRERVKKNALERAKKYETSAMIAKMEHVLQEQ